MLIAVHIRFNPTKRATMPQKPPSTCEGVGACGSFFVWEFYFQFRYVQATIANRAVPSNRDSRALCGSRPTFFIV